MSSKNKFSFDIMNRIGHYDVESVKSNDGAKRPQSYVQNSETIPLESPTDGWNSPSPGYISAKRLQRRQSKKDHQNSVNLGHFVKTPSLSRRLRETTEEERIQRKLERSHSGYSKKYPCLNVFENLSDKLTLWGGSMRSIEGHQGTGAVSFFVLLRWLFGLNVALCVISFCCLNIPILILPQQSYYNELLETFVQGCTDSYNNTVSTDGLQLFLDFFLGSGWLEKSALFYGYYPGTYLLDGSFNYNLPLAYLFVIVICLLISVFLMARYSVRAFRRNALADEEDTLYFIMVYCSWDYSLTNERLCETKKRKLRYTLASEMQDQRFLKNREEKMNECGYRCLLYFVRILINLFVIGCLSGAGYAIFKASEFSSSWTATNTAETGTNRILIFLVEFFPSITITVLNAILPLVFEVVIIAEKYTQDFVIKLTLVRTVFLKLASVAILISSIYNNVISCTSKDSCGSITAPCPSITCWETYVGQELYKLVIIDFFVIVLKVFLVEFPRKLISNKCSWKIVKLIGAAPFEIHTNVLDLVYGQSICWLGFYFAPLFPAIYVIRLFIIFYVKMLSALYACEPPNRPYRTTRTNNFFMIVLIFTFFLSCFPVIYAMSNVNSSHGCGPFRAYDFPYLVVPRGIQDIQLEGITISYNILTSPAVTSSLIIILLVLIYYCSELRITHKHTVQYLRDKMVLENYERQNMFELLKKANGKMN